MIGPRKDATVCYLLAYREPRYIRTLSLLAALERIPEVRMLTVINRSRGWWRYGELLLGLVRMRWCFDPEIYILGFRGHEIFWPVRWLTRGRVLIFDAMMSPSASLGGERSPGGLGRLLAGGARWVEQSIFRHADWVWTDTERHRLWMMDTFGISGQRIVALPVGAVEVSSVPVSNRGSDPFHVLFYGTFLPLHGVEVIFAAARLLRRHPVRLTIIGGRRGWQPWINEQIRSAEGVIDYKPWVPFDDLLTVHIPRADLCLGGPFGNTPQAARVVTGKTQQCMAMGKGVVIAHPMDGFIHQFNCLIVPPEDPESLAAAILWAKDHPAEWQEISRRGQELYHQRFGIDQIRKRMAVVLNIIVTS
ncbi:MAG: glycosyltransferase, partial [Magnetococcales bacterium]|nr:glycosyltransferase [Magnetococcales bacterium]